MKKLTVISIIFIPLLFVACTFLFLDFDGSEELGYHYWRINNYQTSFGQAVDIDGIYAIVSAPGDSLGEACIFKMENDDWQEVKTIYAQDGEIDRSADVAINNELAAIGSPSKNKVYALQYVDAFWTSIDTLSIPTGFTCSGFGRSVDILDNYMVVASDVGPAACFRFFGGEWEFAFSIDMGENQDENEYFSFWKPKIRLSEDFIITGKCGHVRIYKWSANESIFIKQFVASNSDQYSYYGSSIAIDDSCVMVGDYYYMEGCGQVYVYRYEDTTWTEEIIPAQHSNFGYSLSLKDDFVVVGSTALNIWSGGAAAIYEYSGANDSAMSWNKKRDFYESKRCGNDVAISDEYIILSGSSCAYIYKYR